MTYPLKFPSTEPSVFSVGAVHERVALPLLLLGRGATEGCCVAAVIAAGATLAEVVAEEPSPLHPASAVAKANTARSRPARRFTRLFISILRTVTSHCAYVPVGKGCLKGGAVRCAQGASGPVFREGEPADCSEATGIHARGFLTRSHGEPS